ncbi:MAG: phosphonopyruvate decarboxylase [Ruminococcus sp.]|nr:phosphonopyruvate decarboxylase [Ruminococcus sp.]
MKAERFAKILGAEFFTGVPDSALKGLCDYLCESFGTSSAHHLIAANEGNAAAAAAGYYLSTGNIPVVYMQNSGEGNIINPAASLLSPEVYGIPMIFVIGWRGQPGVPDEPQHRFQGKITLALLETMGIDRMVMTKDTTEQELSDMMKRAEPILSQGRQVAIVVESGAITHDRNISYQNNNTLTREDTIRLITEYSGEEPIIATTGKAGRELFELRAKAGTGHHRDLLTVGSMGHCSSIALGIAMNIAQRVWCIDGDGALIMHMGAMTVIGKTNPQNLVHIVINNCAHESVGGMPTSAESIDLPAAARACGYEQVFTADDESSLRSALSQTAKGNKLTFIEVKAAIGSRADLGRPTTAPIDNKKEFMDHLQKLNRNTH